MADEQTDPNATALWPMNTATVKLARNLRAPKEEGESEPPYHVPPTEGGSIKIGMECTIFLPSRAVQEIGFTPFKLVDGEAVDATRELLAHYSGIYKKIQ